MKKTHIFLVITPPVDAEGSGSRLSGLPILNRDRFQTLIRLFLPHRPIGLSRVVEAYVLFLVQAG